MVATSLNSRNAWRLISSTVPPPPPKYLYSSPHSDFRHFEHHNRSFLLTKIWRDRYHLLTYSLTQLLIYTWGAATPLTLLSLLATMLEVYFVRTKTELKCGNLKFLGQYYSQTVFVFDWRIIPRTTVSKQAIIIGYLVPLWVKRS